MKRPMLLLVAAAFLFPMGTVARAQVRTLTGAGPIREKPPGQLATISRRPPDFSAIRFLGMQRNYRDELRAKLMVGHAAIRLGRPVMPMQPIVWPPEPVE